MTFTVIFPAAGYYRIEASRPIRSKGWVTVDVGSASQLYRRVTKAPTVYGRVRNGCGKAHHIVWALPQPSPAAIDARDWTRTLFAQTVRYVAATAALFALGAYLGRNLSSG